MTRTIAAACCLLLICPWACAPAERAQVEQSRQAGLKSLQPIVYHHIGGPSNDDDAMTIAPDGAVAGRTARGAGAVKLSELERLRLARLFENWGELKPEYPSPRAARVAMTQIQYGDRMVTVADDVRELPDDLQRIAAELQRLLSLSVSR